ncbi:hypothetical protein K492DRAFT_196988 [Lichtheimia hyalospora FSU 10163]|nr:hypothetical protein K492DRAFT_196988 [Lichtheimia hyalospora FSU 10163]
MASDTDDEYREPYTINITLESDKDNKLKRFFERGLSALLVDPHFLLIYVPENGANMQIIQPANDLYHRKRMIQRINEAKRIPSFYYALSHLWGISENNQHLWHEIGDYVDDENGQPVNPVSMRPEKRDTLIAMLKDHPDSYWWIDVLCARTDTPLDIMGDIYSFCLECIAMIDCEPSLIPQLHTLMMDVREEFPKYGNLDSESLDRKQNDKRLSDMTELIYALSKSAWWRRVWTWQEMALPFGDVRLMAETGSHRPSSNTITVDDLLDYFNANFRIEYIAHVLDPTDSEAGLMSAITLDTWLDEIFHSRRSNKLRIEKKSAEKFCYLIASLGGSPRRCMDPVDYVYGVLGIFQFKIPRMTDPNAVWQCFLSELDNYMEMSGIKNDKIYGTTISDRAYRIDLRKATDMTDVYKDYLLNRTLDE